jgi:CheY-like chemotaxis protein
MTAAVLVVEDNAAHRYAKVRLLTQAGYSVVEASDGEQALHNASRAEVVLLDVFLPDMDGYDVCRKLRADPTTANLPIILMSGVYAIDVIAEEGMRVGADAFLSKPVPAKLLTETIEKAIRKRFA